MEDSSIHVPVMPAESIEYLALAPGKIIVDGTFGGGGHTRLIAEAVSPGGRVLAIDRDLSAIDRAQGQYPDHVTLIHGSYAHLPDYLDELGIEGVDGILLDLGLSSDQLDSPTRGFSFQTSGDLDLRFDTTAGEPAWQWLARLPERELADVIYQYGEERYSRSIARRICQVRQQQSIQTADQLARVVRSCVPRSRKHAIDPATRTFQALRIAVNAELKHLEKAMERLPACLNSGGRLVVISFHSLEDRIVKQSIVADPRLKKLTKKPLRPTDEEMAINSRSRSAKMRVAEKVDGGAR